VRFRWKLWSLLLLLAAETVALGAFATRAYWRSRATGTPVVRGEKIADRMGCFGCHGPGGARPIPNPGSKGGEVPGWVGGTWMMWNSSEKDVRAWIVNGHPPDREPDPGALIAMPAYGKLLGERDVDDLVAYVLAVSQFGWPEDAKVVEGREVAVKLGCFGCHGPEGRGLVLNPGSFKGYIPGWEGADYLELVRDDDEFRQWVRKGICDRLASNPAARFFLDRQPVAMPAYGDKVTDSDLDALLAYVRWVRATPRGRGVKS
jgi:mono/diheme cytochrome c family protein